MFQIRTLPKGKLNMLDVIKKLFHSITVCSNITLSAQLIVFKWVYSMDN